MKNISFPTIIIHLITKEGSIKSKLFYLKFNLIIKILQEIK
jgi:hypothetical protein